MGGLCEALLAAYGRGVWPMPAEEGGEPPDGSTDDSDVPARALSHYLCLVDEGVHLLRWGTAVPHV